MGKTVPLEGKTFPSPTSGGAALDRIASFRVTYVAIFCFVLLYVFSVKGLEQILNVHFRSAVAAASRVDPDAGPVAEQVAEQVDRVVHDSLWVRVGGVRVTAIVLGADGQTLLYAGARRSLSPASEPSTSEASGAAQLLPPLIEVIVSVPHNSLAANAILVTYAAMLITTLFLYERRRARIEEQRLTAAVADRETTAARAARIEAELREVSQRVEERVEAEVQQEIRSLQEERARLQDKLDGLARREHELRAEAGQVQQNLQDEHRALEELLEEALSDLERRDEEIRSLGQELKRASKGKAASNRAREAEQLGRRLRTLYKNLELDDRVVNDLAALGDESLRLRAEEAIKRLSDDVETAAVRRKVGGLPPHVTAFELGFAGKGRIYYTTGRQRRFRLLLVGGKNTQKTDLEYLSRLPRE